MKAWQHQTEGIEFLKDRKGSMLAWEMGTGKSKAALDYIEEMGFDRVLIIAPQSVVKDVWPVQYARHASPDWNLVSLWKGSSGKRVAQAREAMKRGGRVAIAINYESAYRPTFASWAMKADFQLMVLDESHRIKAPGGVASRFVHRLSAVVPYRLALTGTPMPHSPLDIYAQYRALDDSVFGTSVTRFRARYAVMGGYEMKEIKGWRRQEELQSKFYSLAHRVKAADVLDLPPMLDTPPMTFELEPEGRRIYRDMAEEFLADLGNGQIATAANALTRLLRLQQVTSGFLRDEHGVDVVVDTGKRKLLGELVEDMGNEPIVVFCRFRKDLETVHDVAEKLGRPSFEISGSRKELDLWNNGGGILAVQIQSGGLGIDLTLARYAIYYSLGFSLGDYLQSVARVYRYGQTKPVAVYHLVADRTVDQTVLAALAAREEVVESIMRRGL